MTHRPLANLGPSVTLLHKLFVGVVENIFLEADVSQLKMRFAGAGNAPVPKILFLGAVL